MLLIIAILEYHKEYYTSNIICGMVKNHGYNTPVEGSSDWHIPLNDNFEKLDVDIEVRDIESNIGEYIPYSGAKFLAMDTETVFLGNGNEWEELSSFGQNPTVDSLHTKRINDIHYVTPDSDLQTALDDLPNTGGMLVLSAGTHTVDSPFRRDINDVTVIGQGKYTTKIEASGDFNTVELVGTDSSTRRTNWTFRDLEIDTAHGSTSNSVFGKWSHGCHFEHVRFTGFSTSASDIYCQEVWDWNFYFCKWRGCGNDNNNEAGVYLYNGDSDSTNHFNFVCCRFEPIDGYAIYSNNSGSGLENGRCRIIGCKFHGYPNSDSRPTQKSHIEGQWKGLIIANCTFTHTNDGFVRVDGMRVGLNGCETMGSTDGVHFDIAASRSRVANCYIYAGESGTAIHLRDKYSTVVNNVCDMGDIVIGGSTGTTITGNVLRNAQIQINTQNTIASSNTLFSPPNHGIYVRDSGVILTGNLIQNAGGDGIHLEDVYGGSVSGNIGRGNTDDDIASSGSSDYLAVTGNHGNINMVNTNNSIIGNTNY